MSAFQPAILTNRALIAVTGLDAVAFLDNLVTNDVDGMPVGAARFAALLSPQGKILFEFFAQRTEGGFLLDTLAEMSAPLIKRLTLYRLRAKVQIEDAGRGVLVSADPVLGGYQDPREPRLGFRSAAIPAIGDDVGSYHQHRIALGVAEGGRDYALGDTFPHEANYDRLSGVSFTKGCFIGQEVVARMQNKSVVRKRVVKITGSAPLAEAGPVLLGEAEIGRVGSVDGVHGLALLRLDRAAEAIAKSQSLTAGGVTVTPDSDALARYAKSVAERPVIDL